jgi:hypothetical protein
MTLMDEYEKAALSVTNTLGKSLREWADKATNYLTITNAGGAVAVLSFLGNSAELGRHFGFIHGALILFTVGVLSAGVLIAKQFYKRDKALSEWTTYIEANQVNAETWKGAITILKTNTKPSSWDKWLGWFPFIFFVLGCICGGVALILHSCSQAPVVMSTLQGTCP